MNRLWRTFLIAVLSTACCEAARAQVAPPTILAIDIENFVAYYDDVPDASRRATDPNATTAVLGRNFAPSVLIADIVAVNGQPAKGTFVYHALTLNLRTAPAAGQGIADIVRNNINNQAFEILKSDGTPIGTIMTSGLGVGSAPPGAPVAVTQGNNAIVGGTGAFLGARGQVGLAVQTSPARLASMTEDPVNRRRFGGGRSRFTLHVIPLFRPEIVNTTHGPAVTHSSASTLVYAFDPASPAERLSLFAAGLGPTVPGVDPGKPFPSTKCSARWAFPPARQPSHARTQPYRPQYLAQRSPSTRTTTATKLIFGFRRARQETRRTSNYAWHSLLDAR